MRYALSLAFFLLAGSVYSQELDSLRQALHRFSAEDSLRVGVLNELCRIQRTSVPDSALLYGNEALRISRKNGYLIGEATALNNIGKVYFQKGEYEEGLAWQEKAMAFAKKHQLKKQLANALNSGALDHHYMDNYAPAIDLYLQAMAIEEELQNNKGIAKVMTNLSMLYYDLGDKEKALEFGFSAEKILEATGGEFSLRASVLNNIGLIYSEQKRYSDALNYYKQSLEQHEHTGNAYNIAISVGNIGDCYVDLNQLKEAEVYILRHNKLAKALGAAYVESAAILSLGWLRVQQGRVDEAIPLLEQGLAMAEQAKITKRIDDSYWQLAHAYMKKGDYRKASKYWELAYEINDSLRSNEVIDIVAKTKKNYEMAQKQAEVDKLANETKFKTLALDRERNFRLFLMVVVLLLIIVAALAFYGYRIKTKLSEELKKRYEEISRQKTVIESINLELQEKAFRAQMNPHFIFNCLNSIQYLIAKGENDEAFSYLTKFSVLLRSILEHSDRDKIKLNEELEFLELYLQLESLRFDHNFNYFVDHNAAGDELIPPLMIQPLVENAIVHGLLHKEGERKLDIAFRKDADAIICEIRDNGIGRQAAQRNKPLKGHRQSKGVELSRQRLTVHNNKVDDTSFIIEDLYNAEGKPLGTSVKLKIV